MKMKTKPKKEKKIIKLGKTLKKTGLYIDQKQLLKIIKLIIKIEIKLLVPMPAIRFILVPTVRFILVK